MVSINLGSVKSVHPSHTAGLTDPSGPVSRTRDFFLITGPRTAYYGPLVQALGHNGRTGNTRAARYARTGSFLLPVWSVAVCQRAVIMGRVAVRDVFTTRTAHSREPRVQP